MTYTGIFIDDEDLVYAETLSTDNTLKFSILKITDAASLAKTIFDAKPDIVALDYRLDGTPGLSASLSYKGSALAQHLRDMLSEHPDRDFAVVLVSAEQRIRTLYRPDKTAHDLFDRVYVKEQINKNGAAIRNELISLASAYQSLRNKRGKYIVSDILGLQENEHHYSDRQDLVNALTDATLPHVVIRYLLRNIIERNGLLLDSSAVAARLGVEPSQIDSILPTLASAGVAYSGLLQSAWPRWWAHRLDEWALTTFGRRATSLTGEDRARQLSEKLSIELKPATSRWNDSANELFSFSCACCRMPTELRHSLAVFESDLPKFAQRRRLCWDCFQTDRYEDTTPAIQIDESDKALAIEVKNINRNK